MRRRAQRGRVAWRLCLVGLIACPLSAWVGVQVAYPFVLANRMQEENDALQKEVRGMELDVQRLERRMALLQTPEGMERAAREKGWVQPQERRLEVPLP